MDPAKHVSKNKETGMYCVYDSKGKKVKEFEDKKDAVSYATKNHDDLMKEAKVYSKPAKLPRAVAMNPKVRAAQRAHAKGDWDGNVDKEGNAIVHINSKPYTVTEGSNYNINEDLAYHQKAIAHHSDYAKSHKTEVRKHDKSTMHPDHKTDHNASHEHHWHASNYHQKAHDAAKQHGTNSSQYKTAAKNAHLASSNAHKAHTPFESKGAHVKSHPNKSLTIKNTHKESVNTADRKPETYRKPDGKMGTRMVPTHKDVVKEGTEVGETKWAAVNMFAGGDKFGGRGVQITGLNGQGKANMELLRQKGAYMQMPAKELPKLIKLLQQAMKMSRDTKKEEVELDEAMSPAEKAAHDRAVAAFKARGGKVKKLPPGKAAGYHGKDDPGHGVHGMLNKPDTGKFGTKKKVKSMNAQKESTDMKTFFDIRKAATLEINDMEEGIFTGLQKKGSSDSQAGAQTRAYQATHGPKSNANPHNHEMHAKAAFKSGMKSKSQIIKHVEKKTGQKIHPDVHKMVHNSKGLSD